MDCWCLYCDSCGHNSVYDGFHRICVGGDMDGRAAGMFAYARLWGSSDGVGACDYFGYSEGAHLMVVGVRNGLKPIQKNRMCVYQMDWVGDMWHFGAY